MKILSLCPKSFAANTYMLVSGNEAFVVDPAVSVDAIERALLSENATLCGIILTHGHFDHTVSVDVLRDRHPAPLLIHSGDAPMLTNGLINGFYDFYGQECTHRAAEQLVHEGEEIQLGSEAFTVISTPGHSPGSICLLCPADDGNSFLVTGDTLFASSIGRCDLWNGNEQQIRESLILLKQLEPSMRIYAGHGPSAALGDALKAARYYIDF